MILYSYKCDCCGHPFDEYCYMQDRDIPTVFPCMKCGEYAVLRVPGCGGFSVPEGGVGNAENGYSSTHGDAENFKAKSKGIKPPYDK